VGQLGLLAVFGALEGDVGLALNLVGEVGEVLGGQKGCEGRTEMLVSCLEASKALVALVYPNGGQYLLGGGDGLAGGPASYVGVETREGGCDAEAFGAVGEG
jgi:hypothetical protein